MTITPTTCKLPGCSNPPVGGRGLCDKDYAVHRRRLIAYGTWDSGRVDPTDTIAHLAALRASGMGTRRIEQLTGLHRATLQYVYNAGFLDRYTQEQILSVPIPATPFDASLAPGTQIPIIGSTRRLRALAAIGWTTEVLAKRLGVTRLGVTRATAPMQSNITVRRARDIATLFADLETTDGPSKRARSIAELKGWARPLAWDDDTIDDPAAEPMVVEVDVDLADRIADERAVGYSDAEVAARWGLKLDTLQQRLRRAGIPRTDFSATDPAGLVGLHHRQVAS